MLAKIRRNLVAGILTAIPILVTVWVISFLVGVLVALGSPFVRAYVDWLKIHSPTLAEGFTAPWFQGTISVAIVLAALYVLGEIATAVAGRRLLATFDYVMARIPIVQSIYGAARQLVTSFQTRPGNSQRVVLIEFPSPEMKTVGLVTRIFKPSCHARLDNQRSDDFHYVWWRCCPSKTELLEERSNPGERRSGESKCGETR